MFLSSRLLSEVPGVRHTFSTRSLNWPAAVVPTTRPLAGNLATGVLWRALDSPPGAILVQVDQVHSAKVRDQREASLVSVAIEADALISSETDRFVAVRTADCAPLLFAGEGQRGTVVAAVHAGWRGATSGIVRATVMALLERGVDPAGLTVVIGPTIGLDAFEVGPEVIVAARQSLDGDEPRTARSKGGGVCLDLVHLLSEQLQRCRVPKDRIETVGGCTYSQPERFFSYRRDKGVTGRHLSVIGLVGSR